MIVQAPFTHSGIHLPQMMRQVIYALLPAWLFSIYLFGPQTLLLTMSCLASAIIVEWLCQCMNPQHGGQLSDGSAIVTALILAMSLPPHAPIWLGIIGGFLAITLGKQCYGGLGQNLFNPAMFARVVLLIAFPVQMTHWVVPSVHYWQNLNVDALTSATPLAHEQGYQLISVLKLLIGQTSGSMGETSIIALSLGGIYLLYKKIISYPLVIATLGGCLIPAIFMHWIAPNQSLPPIEHLTSGH